jgi:hypothetical protein
MSHHYSGPDNRFPNDDARLDICDLFAFQSPHNPGKSVLIMNVHPSFGVNPFAPTGGDLFAAEAIYEICVDVDGDIVEDIVYRVTFSEPQQGNQTATLRRITGQALATVEAAGDIIIDNAPVSFGQEVLETTANDYHLFVGHRSDPFFFDVMGAINQFQFTNSDFFADKNIAAIAIELPNSAFGTSSKVNIWGRVLIPTAMVVGPIGTTFHGWAQIDRAARPTQANFLLSGDIKAAYLSEQPSQDVEHYLAAYAHSLEHTGGYSSEEAIKAAQALVPEVLSYNYKLPAQYPLNGRKLTDDVADVFLSILTNGKVTADGIAAHTDLIHEFPYLGDPHQ